MTGKLLLKLIVSTLAGAKVNKCRFPALQLCLRWEGKTKPPIQRGALCRQWKGPRMSSLRVKTDGHSGRRCSFWEDNFKGGGGVGGITTQQKITNLNGVGVIPATLPKTQSFQTSVKTNTNRESPPSTRKV